MVGKEERAGMALAGLHVGEILRADKLCQRLPDREQKGRRSPPPAERLKLERSVPTRAQGNDPAKGFVAFEQPIQRLQLCKSLRCQRAPLVSAHKASEPFAQGPGLIRHLVELAR